MPIHAKLRLSQLFKKDTPKASVDTDTVASIREAKDSDAALEEQKELIVPQDVYTRDESFENPLFDVLKKLMDATEGVDALHTIHTAARDFDVPLIGKSEETAFRLPRITHILEQIESVLIELIDEGRVPAPNTYARAHGVKRVAENINALRSSLEENPNGDLKQFESPLNAALFDLKASLFCSICFCKPGLTELGAMNTTIEIDRDTYISNGAHVGRGNTGKVHMSLKGAKIITGGRVFEGNSV